MFNVELIGRIGGDAEVKQFDGQKEYVSFRMVVESDYRKPIEGRAPTSYWLSVASISPNHLALAKHLTKGRLVFVRGCYEDKIWTNESGLSIICRNVKATEINVYFWRATINSLTFFNGKNLEVRQECRTFALQKLRNQKK